MEYGGPITLERSWAISFLRRHGYVKRKATRTARKEPGDIETTKASFLEKIADIVKKYLPPRSLTSNLWR